MSGPSLAVMAKRLPLETRINGLQLELDDLRRFVNMELEAARRRDKAIEAQLPKAKK